MKLEIKYDRHGGKQFFLDGQSVTEAEANAACPPKPIGVPMATTAHDSSKVRISQAGGCHPSQVASMNEYLKKKNVVGAQFRPDGKVEFTGRRARRDFARARGLVDFDGGYGD